MSAITRFDIKKETEMTLSQKTVTIVTIFHGERIFGGN